LKNEFDLVKFKIAKICLAVFSDVVATKPNWMTTVGKWVVSWEFPPARHLLLYW